jgi:spore maturation protein CgeB
MNTLALHGHRPRLNIVILGLSITSSWGNGHATTYRALVRELAARKHSVVFLERNLRWYAANRDLPKPPFCQTELYKSVTELKAKFGKAVANADLVIVGSYVRDGALIGEWVCQTASGMTAFYDIDTPVTIARLEHGDLDYLSRALVRKYDLYLSFTGGPILDRIESEFGSPMARPLYCSVDAAMYFPERTTIRWDLGYMGTYSDDRQPVLKSLLLEPARKWKDGRFVVAGPQYPKSVKWPRNVKRFVHLSPAKHRAFYNAQRFTLNITRAQMVQAGYSPSVRLFEAAACGTPIISDSWPGLETILKPEKEILVADSSLEALEYLQTITESQRCRLGDNARRTVLAKHTARHRVLEIEQYYHEITGTRLAVAS